MAVDDTKIKQALDNFEKDDFIASKDILKGEIKDAMNDYFKDKLGLKNDIEPKPEVKTDDVDDTDDGGSED